MMVGDSKRSDIAPAIELGITAVHIPGDTWPFAQAELDRRAYHERGRTPRRASAG
jgi:FMN phosphatase YigB (HAD superfamily)